VAELVQIRVDWNRTALAYRLPAFHHVHVDPEPGYPAGRKGLQLAGAWRQYAGRTTDGMLILDGDVAADLADLAAMRAAIHVKPQVVHTAAVRLWPASTHEASWVWGHWDREMTQDMVASPRRFSFCFTYLPRQLIGACIKAGLEGWTFPHVDRLVSAEAERAHIGCEVVPGCSPRHLHF
jgi:hypothetical protein